MTVSWTGAERVPECGRPRCACGGTSFILGYIYGPTQSQLQWSACRRCSSFTVHGRSKVEANYLAWLDSLPRPSLRAAS